MFAAQRDRIVKAVHPDGCAPVVEYVGNFAGQADQSPLPDVVCFSAIGDRMRGYG